MLRTTIAALLATMALASAAARADEAPALGRDGGATSEVAAYEKIAADLVATDAQTRYMASRALYAQIAATREAHPLGLTPEDAAYAGLRLSVEEALAVTTQAPGTDDYIRMYTIMALRRYVGAQLLHGPGDFALQGNAARAIRRIGQDPAESIQIHAAATGPID